MSNSLRCLTIAAVVTTALAQGPGDGVSKTTYASSQPWVGMSFMQKYLPTTAAEDSGTGNYAILDGPTVQGRVQLTKSNQFTERNCKLYSAVSSSHLGIGAGTAMTAPAAQGDDCKYEHFHKYNESTSIKMWSIYAHTADQCCKGCAATSGCTHAHYTGGVKSDESEGERRLQGPQPNEGFGLHLVNVLKSATTGGLTVAELEAHYKARLGDMSAFDTFMDYNVVLYAGEDLPSYAAALTKDNIKFLTATWKSNTGSTWYSVFVHVPASQMIIELASETSPGSAHEDAMASLEARMSPRQIERYAGQKANGVLDAVAVTRACSNISSIEYFYTEAVGLKTVHTLDTQGVSRRCFEWTGADSDVCFSMRSASSQYDKTFSVFDFEKMIWSAHKSIIGTNVNEDKDKYNDNHYAVDLMQYSGNSLSKWLKAHYAEAFPINFPTTYFAWDCTQEYLIDPTGWAVQSDFQVNYPSCHGGPPGVEYV